MTRKSKKIVRKSKQKQLTEINKNVKDVNKKKQRN